MIQSVKAFDVVGRVAAEGEWPQSCRQRLELDLIGQRRADRGGAVLPQVRGGLDAAQRVQKLAVVPRQRMLRYTPETFYERNQGLDGGIIVHVRKAQVRCATAIKQPHPDLGPGGAGLVSGLLGRFVYDKLLMGAGGDTWHPYRSTTPI